MSEARPQVGGLAWIAVLAGAATFGLAAAALGPALGDLLQSPLEGVFADPYLSFFVRPEPAEFGRGTLVLGAPIAIALAIVAIAEWGRPQRLQRLAGPAAAAAQVLVLGLAAWGVLHRDPDFGDADLASFTTAALVAAPLLAALAIALGTDARMRSRLRRLEVATRAPRWRWGLPAGVAVLTAIWVLPAIHGERHMAEAPPYVWTHLQVTFEDFAAVANGATPAVDYASQYASLLPYLVDPALSILGLTPGSFTIVATVLSIAALLSIFAILRLVAASSLVAALLYIPVLALSLLPQAGDGPQRVFNADVYQVMPLRYLAPLVLGWLLARRLTGRASGPRPLLFALAGLALFNSPEFGLPALAALAIGLLVGDPDRLELGARLRALAKEVAGGLAIAAALVCAITVVRAGALPDPDLWLLFSRLFGRGGFSLYPLPDAGLYWTVYLTFAGAVVLAATRAAGSHPDRPLTGMLAFAGVFGLGAGAYYLGRSLPENLLALYPAWGLATALLLLAVVRHAAGARDIRSFVVLAGPLGAAVVVVFALMVTTVPTIPAPWTQVERLAGTAAEPSPTAVDEQAAFLQRRTDPGEPIAVVATLGHLAAERAGVDNVSPLNTTQHLVTDELVDRTLDALAEAGGERLLTQTPGGSPADGPSPAGRFRLYQGVEDALRERGWRPVATDATAELTEWQNP